MTLPLSRDHTYVAGSQVHSADLNDIQDQIIALYADQHEIFVSPKRITVLDVVTAIGAADLTQFSPLSNNGTAYWDFEVPVGYRIKSFSLVYLKPTAGNEFTARLVSRDVVGSLGSGSLAAEVAIGSGATSSSDTVLLSMGETLATPHTVESGKRYVIRIDNSSGASSGNVSFYGLRVTVDRAA